CWLYGERPAPHDVLYWNMDTTRMPCRMHEFYLREMYLHNSLVKPNALVIGGEPIDLSLVHAPLYQVSTEDDHIAPWRQTFRINGWITSPRALRALELGSHPRHRQPSGDPSQA